MNSKPQTLFALLCSLSLVLLPTLSCAMENEYERKAVIIKHLVDTIGWPNNVIQNNTIQVCLWGKAPELKPFLDLNGRQAAHYKIHIRQLSSLAEVEKNCQIIFVSKSQQSQAKQIIQRFAKKPILLLSDIDNFAKDGGSMNFMELNNALALSVNLVSIKDSQLHFDLKAYNQITIIPDKKDLE